MRKLLSLLAGEGTTGTAGAGAAAGNDQGTAGAAGAAAAAAGDGKGAGGAAGAAAGAGAAGAAAAGAAAAGADGGAKPASTFLSGAADGKGEGEKGAGEGAKASGAAAAEYELKLPDGIGEVDKPLFDGFKTFAKEQKLDAKTAQGLVDFYAKTIADQSKAQEQAWEKRQADQRRALEAHPKIGGANLEKSQAVTRQAIATLNRDFDGLGTKVVQALEAAGLGDHPDIAYLFTVFGQAGAEDSITRSEPSPKPAIAQTTEERGRRRYAASLSAGRQDQKA